MEQRSSSSSSGVSRQWQEANQEQKENQQLLHLHEEENKKKEGDQDSPAAAPQGLLKRCVDTRERGEEELRQREAQQLDFRSLLGRRVFNAKKNQEEEPREVGLAAAEHRHRHQMDFKANLKGVKAKAEEDRKANSPQQVDFRAVLGKKGAASNSNKPAETPGKNAADFRSVLANKKKPGSPEKNGESGKEAVNNCVDGGINEKKSGGGGGGGGGGEAPEFVEKLSDVTVLDGQRLRLQCRLAASGPADATVTWTLDGKIIKPSKFIVLANEGQRSHTQKQIQG